MKLSFGILLALLLTGNQCISPGNFRRTMLSHEILYEDDQKKLSSLHGGLSSLSKQTTDSQQQPDIPPFIVQLYQTLARNPRKLPFGAQFVRSFSSPPRTKLSSESSVVHFRIRIPTDEKILYAMLHLCMKSNLFKGKPSLKVVDAKSGMVVVRKGHTYNNGECFKVPITALMIKNTSTGSDQVNLVLYVSLIDQLSRLLKHSRIQRSRTTKLKPEVIVFSSSSTPKASPLDFKLPSNSRANRGGDFQERRRYRSQTDHEAKRDSTKNANLATTKEGCFRKSLIVNFAGLGYKDIIAPTIFDAKQCIGVCQYPLGKMANPSQHSLIQQLLHSLYGNRVAKSTCCAAKRFVPLTTMIKDAYSGGYAIRSIEDMIVAECGCA